MKAIQKLEFVNTGWGMVCYVEFFSGEKNSRSMVYPEYYEFNLNEAIQEAHSKLLKWAVLESQGFD